MMEVALSAMAFIKANASAISAIVAVISALVAITGLILQGRRWRFSLGVDLLLKLDERFSTERMLNTRRSAAKALLASSTNDDLDEILDFFEIMGILVRKKAIDPTLAWHSFFYWVQGYFHVAGEVITSVRQTDHTVWKDLVYLYDRMAAIEKAERKCTDAGLALSADDKREFLEKESQVC